MSTHFIQSNGLSEVDTAQSTPEQIETAARTRLPVITPATRRRRLLPSGFWPTFVAALLLTFGSALAVHFSIQASCS